MKLLLIAAAKPLATLLGLSSFLVVGNVQFGHDVEAPLPMLAPPDVMADPAILEAIQEAEVEIEEAPEPEAKAE